MEFSSFAEYVGGTLRLMQEGGPLSEMLEIINPRNNAGTGSHLFASSFEEAITSDVIVALLDAARLQGPSVSYLQLGYLEIDYQVGVALTQLLQSDSRLWNSVEFDHCRGSSLDSCLTFIVPRGNVKEMCLYENNLSNSGFRAVATILASNPLTLSKLDLVEEISEEGAQALSQALQANTTLRSLRLSRCNFSDRSLSFLLEGIALHPCLEELIMEACEFEDNECALVMNTISDHPTIRRIELGSNYFGQQTMDAIATNLKDNRMPNLSILSLVQESLSGRAEIDPLPVGVLGASLKSNTCLQFLDLSFNPLPPNELRDMMEGLRFSNLKSLSLMSCSLGDEHLEIVLSNLPNTLKRLSLNENLISEKSSARILATLESHKGIEAININTDLPCKEVAYHLARLNKGGRHILASTIPLSFWPQILARTNSIPWPMYGDAYRMGYREDVLFYFVKAIVPNIQQ